MRDQAITTMDWLPTIAQLCGAKLPEVKLDGQSLLPIIKSSETASHHEVLHWQFQKRWAVRRGDWKLISNHQGEPQILANLAEDEPEVKNHFGEQAEIVDQLHTLHQQWLEEVTPNR